jgi:hypothetical protein
MKKSILSVLFVLTLALPAMARTDFNVDVLDQEDFKSFSRDLGMAISYVPLSPAAPLGDTLPGFDAGIEASYVKLDKGSLWYQKMDKTMTATGTTIELPNALAIPRVHIQVGLPIIPLDFGVSMSKIPNSSIKLVGYEVKYAILEGGIAMPAVAIRGAYTKLSGIEALDISTKSVDLSISKGVAIFTPYAGVAQVWISSEANHSVAFTGTKLQNEEIRKPKAFAGVKTKIFPFVNLVLEGDFSTVNVYSARLNVNF